MSRQTTFFQTEQDAKQFFEQIHYLNACILKNLGGVRAIRDPEELVSYMSHPINLAIMPVTQFLRDKESLESLRYIPNETGSYVEYIPCRKDSPSIWWHGRVYLQPEEQSYSYNPEITALYNKIIKFIKKNYYYSGRVYEYMGPDFYSQYTLMEGQIELH